MKQNPYFKEAEFKCKCKECEGLPASGVPDALIDLLVRVREHFNAPVIINSGYRCPTHNARVGGAPSSRHAKGDAADFVVRGVKTKEVYEFCENLPEVQNCGLAIKNNKSNEFAGFVHLDTRGRKARWTYS